MMVYTCNLHTQGAKKIAARGQTGLQNQTLSSKTWQINKAIKSDWRETVTLSWGCTQGIHHVLPLNPGNQHQGLKKTDKHQSGQTLGAHGRGSAGESEQAFLSEWE